MNQMHVTLADGTTTTHPPSDNWDEQLHALRMDEWPASVPVVTRVDPLIISLWSPDMKTRYADIEWKDPRS